MIHTGIRLPLRTVRSVIGVLMLWFIKLFGLAGLAVAACWWWGVPHVVGTYSYKIINRERYYQSCSYWGPTGKVEGIPGGNVPENCPAFVTLPLRQRLDALLGTMVGG